MKKSFLLICLAAVQLSVSAVPDMPASVIPQAGTINNQNLDILRQHQMERQIQEDYKRFEQRKESGEAEKDEELKKQQGTFEKAKPEEFATKGVYVDKFEVSPSYIMTVEDIEGILKDYRGKNLTFEQLKEVVAKFNNWYARNGCVTCRAFLPPQALENGVVKIKLVEGRVGDVSVSENKWTKSKYIEERLDLHKGNVFNIQDLERSMVVFNRYNSGVQLTGSLSAGQSEMGTTDVNIKAHEKIPFHITGMMDNSGRKSIGEYRGGLMLRHDSLTKHRDPLTLGFYANKHSITPFADYNFPVNRKDGRIGFMFSSSNSDIGNGAYRIFNIESRSQNYSLYFTQPIIRKPWTELSSTTSIAYKHSATSFDGHDIFEDKVTTATTGLTYRYDTKKGIWYVNQNVGYSFPIFDKNSNYLKVDGGVLRLHDFGHGFVGTIRGNYQFIPKRDVPYVDQMLAGGATTVRGYSEGLLVGRNGYILSAELMFPLGPRVIYTKKHPNTPTPFIGNYVKGFVFADHAGIFPYKGSGAGHQSYDGSDFLASIGFGTKINLPGEFNLRMAWGFPLMSNRYETNSWGRFHIDLSLSPDFDTLVALRQPKGVNENAGTGEESATQTEVSHGQKFVRAEIDTTKSKKEIREEKKALKQKEKETKKKAKIEQEKLKQEIKEEQEIDKLIYGKQKTSKFDLLKVKIKQKKEEVKAEKETKAKAKEEELKIKKELKAKKLAEKQRQKEAIQKAKENYGKQKTSKLELLKTNTEKFFSKIKTNKNKTEKQHEAI